MFRENYIKCNETHTLYAFICHIRNIFVKEKIYIIIYMFISILIKFYLI